MTTHDSVIRIYFDQIIEKAVAAQEGEPSAACAISTIDKAIIHFRTLSSHAGTITLLRQLATMLHREAAAQSRPASVRAIAKLAGDYAAQAADSLPE